MQYALGVGGGEARHELARDLEGLARRQAPNAPGQRGEVLSVDVLHRDERDAVQLADVVHATHDRVRYLSSHAHLGVQARQPTRVVAERVGEELQSDGLTQREIFRAVDLAHSTLAEHAHDPVASGDERPRGEARVVDRRRRRGVRGRGAWRGGRPGCGGWGAGGRYATGRRARSARLEVRRSAAGLTVAPVVREMGRADAAAPVSTTFFHHARSR